MSRPRDETDRALRALIRTSLAGWGIDASIAAAAGDGAIVVRHGTGEVRIARAPEGLPFRWMVASPARERPASSVTGVLRALRGMLDPGWRPGRARIVALAPPPGAATTDNGRAS